MRKEQYERAKKHLEAWLDADLAVSTGQTYQMGSRSLTRAHASEIRKNILFWEKKVNQYSQKRSGIRMKRMIPRDL